MGKFTDSCWWQRTGRLDRNRCGGARCQERNDGFPIPKPCAVAIAKFDFDEFDMARSTKSKKPADETIHYRYEQVSADGADESARTLQLAFSSEFPGEQRANKRDVELGAASKVGDRYWEVLSHNEGDADLSMLNNDGALLDEHDERSQIGKVKHAEISADKVGRAVVEFDGETELSKVRFNQLFKRSRPHISHGYFHTKFLGDERLTDGRVAKRFAWRSGEISSVAVPIDPTVGSRRSATEMAHCTRCGGLFERDEMDGDFRCEDCGPVSRSLKDKMIRAGDKEVSANDLSSKVHKAVMADERFTGKDNKGNKTGWNQVQDLKHDGENWSAIIYCGTDGKCYSIELENPEEDAVELGQETEVQRTGDWEPVNDMAADGLPHGRSAEDLIKRSGSDKEPYGAVAYADSGHQSDGKKRYPIDTKAHAKAAWSYINQQKNADKYSAEDLAKVKAKIESACKKFGIETSDSKRSDHEIAPAPPVAEVDFEKMITGLDTDKLNNLRKKLMADNAPVLDEKTIRSSERAIPSCSTIFSA